MEHIKLFNNNQDYFEYLESSGYTEPSVSYTIQEGKVWYDWVPEIPLNVPVWNYLKSIAGPENLGYWDRYFFDRYEILMFTDEVYDENSGDLLCRSVSFEAVSDGNTRVAWYPYCRWAGGIVVETNDPVNYPLTQVTYRGQWSDCK